MQRPESSPLHRRCAAVVVALAVIAAVGPGADAHKGLVSPFTYNEHVFPIVRSRCGGCHYDGGPTPMSLLSYQAAQPWAEAIREQLVSETTPPWHAEAAGPAPRGGHALSPRELDVLITWAAGGTPEGDVAKTPAPERPLAQWTGRQTVGPSAPKRSVAIAIAAPPASTGKAPPPPAAVRAAIDLAAR